MQIDIDKINSALLVKLLSGVIYYEDPLWKEMIINRNLVSKYFKPLGLELEIHEADGYGFLRQISDNDIDENIPKIIRRQPLSFEVSLLLVILREELERFETKGEDDGHLFLRREAIRELVEVYFRDKSDEVRLIKELDKYINAVIKLGFLKSIINEEREVLKVMPIIKAKINIEFMEEFMEKLNAI